MRVTNAHEGCEAKVERGETTTGVDSGGGDDEMQGKCRQSCCHFSTGLTAAFHGSGHLSARPFFSSFSSSPSPLFPLSVSIEGEFERRVSSRQAIYLISSRGSRDR